MSCQAFSKINEEAPLFRHLIKEAKRINDRDRDSLLCAKEEIEGLLFAASNVTSTNETVRAFGL
jgi:hypothetical protein